METVFTKVLRRLHRKGILPGAVRAVYRLCSNRKVLDMPMELAWEKVYAIAPRPNGSSYWQMPDNGESCYDLSVIIPFYKTEPYALQCIESVLSQVCDFRVETILVDDGSPDRCGEILDSYADRENIVVIHQKNQGVSVARNTGIAAARGEYLMFVDSDDYLADGAIQALMTAARKYHADMVEGSHQMVTVDGKPFRSLTKSFAVALHGKGMFGFPWGKVLKKKLFKHVCFPQGYWYEDCIIANLMFPLSETTVTIPNMVSYYRQNPAGQSFSGNGNPKSIHGLYVAEEILKTYQKLGLEIFGERQRLLTMEFGPRLLFHIQWLDEESIKALFLAACDVVACNHLLPEEHTGKYFYDELIEAFRHRQYDRWKWASMLI